MATPSRVVSSEKKGEEREKKVISFSHWNQKLLLQL
jgi:hypothetical protein